MINPRARLTGPSIILSLTVTLLLSASIPYDPASGENAALPLSSFARDQARPTRFTHQGNVDRYAGLSTSSKATEMPAGYDESLTNGFDIQGQFNAIARHRGQAAFSAPHQQSMYSAEKQILIAVMDSR